MGTYYRRMREAFGIQVVKDLKLYDSVNKKLAAQRNRRVFLLECRRQKLTPRFLEDNIKKLWRIPQRLSNHNITKVEGITQQVTTKFHKLCIADTNRYIEKLEKLLDQLLQDLRTRLPFHVFDDFVFVQYNKYNFVFNRIKRNNIRKIEYLKSKIKNFQTVNDKWLKNVSGVELPPHISGFLALGPKFSLPISNKDINMFSLLSEVEHAIHFLPNDKQDFIRTKATNLITNYVISHKNVGTLTRDLEHDTKSFLKDHPDLLITRSDKGNSTVVMSKTSYLEKSLQLLQDDTTYEVVNYDPTSRIENSCNKLIRSLKDKKFLDETTAKSLFTYNGTCPKYYGLPKIHKADIPLRPIVSCVGASTQPLASYIGTILESAFSSFNKYRIKNTFEFATSINDFTLPDGFVLASFDVVSLFTNITLELVVSILDEHFDLIEDKCIIPKREFLNIITYLYEHTFFSFNNTFYRQKMGVPMGGSTSPILAEIVMNKLLYFVTNQVNFVFPFVYQYVDDLLVALPADETHNTLNIFNSFNNKLVFTMEGESECSVPFLDTRVCRSENNIVKLDWYRKASNSGRYIPYHSYHPMRQKLNIISALKNRIDKICHPSFREKNLKLLENILIENYYPKSLIKKIFQREPRLTIPVDLNVAINSNTKFAKLQYIEGLTQSLSSLFADTNVKIANYNLKKMNSFYSCLKDKTPTLQKSNIIYGIPCNCGSVYIGQTTQKLSKRLALHKSDNKNRPNSTSLSQHVNSTDHRVRYSDSFILHNETNYLKRNFLEMCYIKNCHNSLNQKRDVEGLSAIYTYLLAQNHTKQVRSNDFYISNNSGN